MADFDRSKPSIARVYDYLLGGKDNFEADRALAGQLLAVSPQVVLMVRENRDFLARAVRWVAEQGVMQFIDLGCGLPTEPSTRQSVQAVVPDARVACVDNDPVVVSHLTALHYQDLAVKVVDLDVNDPAAVLGQVRELIDLSRPVCLTAGALLHFYEPAAARDLVARYAAALAPESYVVLSVCTAAPGRDAEQLVKIYSSGPHPVRINSAEDVSSFFGDLDMVPPGVTDARVWRPGCDSVPEPEPRGVWTYGGVARKIARLQSADARDRETGARR